MGGGQGGVTALGPAGHGHAVVRGGSRCCPACRTVPRTAGRVLAHARRRPRPGLSRGKAPGSRGAFPAPGFNGPAPGSWRSASWVANTVSPVAVMPSTSGTAGATARGSSQPLWRARLCPVSPIRLCTRSRPGGPPCWSATDWPAPAVPYRVVGQWRPRAHNAHPASRQRSASRVPRPSMTLVWATRAASRLGSMRLNWGHSVFPVGWGRRRVAPPSPRREGRGAQAGRAARNRWIPSRMNGGIVRMSSCSGVKNWSLTPSARGS